jgi:hypothetical protein
MRLSKSEFLALEHKTITFIGMSGVGKTMLGNKLPRDSWFHYSGDYRIGSRYLSEPIMDNIKAEAMKIPFLRDLLRSDSIYIANNVNIHNLDPVSTFLGKLGNPELDGMPLAKFKERQNLHRQAEIRAMLDVPEFIKKARDIYGYAHFLNDVGGSICEVVTPEVLKILAKHTVIVYLKADKAIEDEMKKRAVASPKPLFYRSDFLDKQVAIYLNENGFKSDAEINPDEFARWIFPRLIEHRKPLYHRIADDYGYTLDAGHVANITGEAELLEWIGAAMAQQEY